MKLEKGLFTDSAEVDNPAGTYRFAKNWVDSNTPGSKENELGFTEVNWGAPYPTIGRIELFDSVVVFSTDDVNCEIGLWENNVYTTIYNNPALNFRRTAPIKGEYRIISSGDTVVTWIDDINTPRILNIDDLSGVGSVNDLNIYQDISNPNLSSYSISDSGGSLATGAYVIITRYKGLDGSVTNWSVLDKTFYINDDPKSTSFQLDDGAVGGVASNKAINLTLTGCDTNFDNLEVGYIKIVNQIVTAFSVFTKVVSSTTNITITGSESTTSVTLEEVLTPNATYGIAKAITQVNNQLVLGNLTSSALPNFQPYANVIRVNYNHDLVNVISNTGSHKDVLPPSLMPGEVYAIYIGLELNKGGWVFYHIPGRPPIATERDAVTTADGLSYIRYQVEDTSNAPALSNMGYWENTTETYPNDPIYDGTIAGGTDLRNQPVRHHRLPTVRRLETLFTSGDATVGVTSLSRLSLHISNVFIPADVQSQIKRWKIFFAKKSPNNCIIGGSDLLQYSFTGPSNPGTYWTTGGNWTIDAPHSGWESFNTMHTDAILGHSLDHLYAPGEFLPDFVYLNYGLTNKTVNNAANTVQLPWNGFRGGGSLLSTTGSNRGQTVGMVLDYTEPSTVKTTVGQLKKVSNFQYIPQNALVGVFKSAYAEGFLASNIAPVTWPGTLFATIPSLQTKGSGDVAPTPVQFSKGEETVYMQYGKIVANAHTSFTSQTLVAMEGQATPDATSLPLVTGGDTFLCYMSYMTAGPLNANHATTSGNPGFEGSRIWRGYVGYSRRNWNYRHQVSGDTSTYYYGKTDPTTLYSPALRTPVNVVATGTTGTLLSSFNTFNQFTYNTDFNSVNEYTVGTTYSVDLANTTQFPSLIIYSNLQGTESSEVSWRIFPSGNRYTMPRDAGEVINLQGVSNRGIFIHTRYSLFRTRADVGMRTTDGENINLKSNTLFEITPEELSSTGGSYCGTQNKFSCVLTKPGYFFVDDLQGKVFLVNETIEEISANGLRKFFRDSMNIHSDNSFYTNGYTVVWDEQMNRLLLSKKQGATSWTISYNPLKKVWISYHDYTPDMVFNLVGNKTYSLKDQRLYLHNSNSPGKFYTGTTYPSIIDVVQNPEPDVDKVFVSSNWLSESYNASGVLQYTDTFNYLTCRSLDFCTNRIALSTFNNIDSLYSQNIRNINRVWYYNDIRDVSISPGFTQGFYQNYELDLSKLNTNMEWYDQRKFTDKFVICRLEYSNLLGNRFLLLDTAIEYRHATK